MPGAGCFPQKCQRTAPLLPSRSWCFSRAPVAPRLVFCVLFVAWEGFRFKLNQKGCPFFPTAPGIRAHLRFPPSDRALTFSYGEANSKSVMSLCFVMFEYHIFSGQHIITKSFWLSGYSVASNATWCYILCLGGLKHHLLRKPSDVQPFSVG